jgi:hypothetical protein
MAQARERQGEDYPIEDVPFSSRIGHDGEGDGAIRLTGDRLNARIESRHREGEAGYDRVGEELVAAGDVVFLI